MKQKIINKYLILKNSKIHGKGIYAKINIPKNTKVIQYIGDIVTKKQGDKRAEAQFNRAEKNKSHGSVYVFELNEKQDIDGNTKDNYAKFINHSCDPNCRFTIKNNQIWIISKTNIKKGQELYYDYGYDIDYFEEHPCKCNSDNCPGFIVGEKDRKKLIKLLKKGKVWKNS